ncbi:hypothetical protein H6F90_29340 [Trichocoleus sp. FACHB-591]|uniref:hypothetical protein n=1 Tax=Trichocoleus sp. FACHB-591 TaxID=2692872 RepID=UPI001687CE35|nr:hypothetical protein [Trichocoleus sp. FACHB-591]MBD2099172.1 hypothetical protein [Trichocoleus sp. FACHB-591]
MKTKRRSRLHFTRRSPLTPLKPIALPRAQPKIKNFLNLKAWPRFCVTRAIVFCSSPERSLL